MVGRTPSLSRELIGSSISSLKYGGSGDIGSKLGLLGRLRDQLLVADSVLLLEFLSTILDLLSDSFSPVRKFVTQLIGQIGLKHLELLPEIIPALIDVLKDDTPAVARQAISSGIDIFRYALVNVAIQGLYSSEFNESLKSSWACVLKFKDEIYSMAFTAGSDSRRLPALKFVASVVLLYTSDPNGSLAPPSDPISEGNFEEFNASWLRSGHPILNVGDLSVEAGRSLSLLLDQLRSPSMKSHSNLMLIVLIKSLSAIARKRSVFYGRILPVLLGLDLSTSSRKGIHLAGVNHALKNSFEACLDCSHPGSVPWRVRLVSALAENKVGRPIQGKDLDDGRRAVWRGDLNVAQVQEEEKPFIAFDTKHVNAGRKRTADMPHLTEDKSPGKRARSTPERLEESEHDTSGKLDSTSTAPTPSESDAVSEPVQQLVAMFGALVAQGEKAVASLEILISSISADLLAEVVLANMRNIPPKLPRPEEDEGPYIDTQLGKIESVTHLKYLSLVLTDVLSQSNSAGNATGVEELHHSVASNLEQTEEEKPHVMLVDNSVAYDGSTLATQPATATEHVSGEDIPSVMEISYKDITSEANEPELVENGIPGLVLSTQDDGLHENVAIVSEDTADLDDSNQVKFIDLGAAPLELAQSLPSERSEELSPKAEVTDITSINSSTATSVALSSQLILPQMSAPVIQLADEQKDQLQEVAFERIVDAYKQVAIAGGSQVRFSILAHSGMEFPSELDPWKLLKTHILSDYVNHEGHELTLRVLYRLFGEAEEDRDFFSSSTATSVYETFLLQVAEAVRDFFPASDKSLGRLLGEVPYLPKSLLEMLEHLCSPGSRDNDDKELRGGDRVTQGLSTAWSLILLRPPIRDACLKICLKSAVHHLEEVRMKAIRLVANKLYPLSHISGKIEDFAKEMLLSVASDDHITLIKEADGTHAELQKDEIPSCINQSASSAVSKDISSETHQLPASESIPSSTVAEVQRCMSLYFALCTKKHSLLRQIFDVYEGTSKATKQIIHGQIPLLVRTIGSSRDLLDIISDPPTGSEGLVTQAVSTLTDGTVPSPDLIFSVKRLYNRKLKDVDVLLPILPFLPKDEILLIFPHLVNTPLDKFQVVLSRVLQGSNRSTPVLTPAEALIAIHRIDPEKDGIPLKKVTDACNACFEQRQIFTQQVIAKVLNQLVEQIPLPLLFMRTVLQAIGAFPALVDFIMEILSRLVSKQIWKYPKLWVGFMKCTLLTKPQSFAVLLQLPPAQLENVLNRTAALKAPLIAHASQPHLRSSLPRSTLVVLGIVSEVQNSTQAQPTQTQNSPAQTQNSPAQTLNSPAQTQNSSAQTQTRTEETQTQTLDTGNSGKEEGADKSKESSTVD